MKKIHSIVERESAAGKTDCHYRESEASGGGKEFAAGQENRYVVKTKEDASASFDRIRQKLCIVSQTTFNYNNFQEIVEILSEKGYDKLVLNTICSATKERQTEARALRKRWML